MGGEMAFLQRQNDQVPSPLYTCPTTVGWNNPASFQQLGLA